MSTINQIAHELGKGQVSEVFINTSIKEKSEILAEYLEQICELAEEIDILTGGIHVDVDFLLGVQGSYEIGVRDGSINPLEVEPPNILYEESLFPSLENAKGIEVQAIEEEGTTDGEPTDNTDNEGHGTQDTTD